MLLDNAIVGMVLSMLLGVNVGMLLCSLHKEERIVKTFIYTIGIEMALIFINLGIGILAMK